MRNLEVTAATLLVACTSASVATQEVTETEVHGHTMYTVFQAGEVPAIDQPVYLSVAEADRYYYPNEPLLVVTDRRETHAFSLWHLEDHLVVNDRLGGRMITVTW